MQTELIVIFGNTNSARAELSKISMERIERAVQLARSNPGARIITTGGFGPIFNLSDIPHGRLLFEKLIELGVSESRIVGFTMSSSTIQDVLAVRQYLKHLDEDNSEPKTTTPGATFVDLRHQHVLHCVTSDYHQSRVSFLCARLLPACKTIMHICDSNMNEAEWKQLQSTEQAKLQDIRSKLANPTALGLSDFNPSKAESLATEFRHYDGISYYPITGAFLIVGWTLSTQFPNNYVTCIATVTSTIVLVLLFCLYYRFAETAEKYRFLLNTYLYYFDTPFLGVTDTKPKSNLMVFSNTKRLVWAMFCVFIIVLYLKNSFAF